VASYLGKFGSKGVSTYVGCTFGPVHLAGLSDVGTSGVTAYAFGIEHRVWMPVPDANNGAVPWGPGRPRFCVTWGFRPSHESLFVAARWIGNSPMKTPITCDGARTAGFDACECEYPTLSR
jgi:hypothetical protein